jgi:hypothetical protein
MRSFTRMVALLVLTLVMFTALASPALAQNGQGGNNNNQGQNNNNQGQNNNNQGGKRAPEIDPGSAMSGIVLLAGGLLLFVDSRRRIK